MIKRAFNIRLILYDIFLGKFHLNNKKFICVDDFLTAKQSLPMERFPVSFYCPGNPSLRKGDENICKNNSMHIDFTISNNLTAKFSMKTKYMKNLTFRGIFGVKKP